MRRALLASLLVVAPIVAAVAQSQGVEALLQRFKAEERILFAGMLADPAVSAEFVRDGQGDAQAFTIKWRARLADFCRRWNTRPHPMNDKARSLRQAVEPAQWELLFASLRYLHNSSKWTDQAAFRILSGMITDADDGLKKGDPSDMRKLESTVNPKLADGMQKFLSSEEAQLAVAEQAKRDAAAAEAARQDQAKKDELARNDQAQKDQARKEQDAAAAEKARREKAARDQAEAAARAGRSAQQKPGEPGAGDAGKTFDGSQGKGSAPVTPVDAPPVVVPPPSELPPVTSIPSTLPKPDLTVRPGGGGGPPSPSVGGDDDMAELRKMKTEAQAKTGGRKVWAGVGGGLLGALLGGLIGFLAGGPLGAAIGAGIGAAALGGTGYFVAKHFWG